ncbi:hypothetical protein SAMN04488144_1483 [Methylobacterium sp. 190mf]|uniref:cytochrome P450 n=1 Tax=Methylobacterium sp. 190mf TaxID=1761798 RepID=UPI00089E60FC|nr:cytochrome P450 [Methylobacterium sp. 190mf]SEG70444.1 hypothetical protein SAMN04488144_1483 [Methylobacterium sp. 190mf]
MPQSDASPDETRVLAQTPRLDARDPIFRERPHQVLDELRLRDPVHQDRVFDRVVLTRAADVAATLADRSLSADPSKARPTAYGWRPETGRDKANMASLDDPDHARLRGLVAKAFTARAVQSLQSRVEQFAANLLDTIDPTTPFDLVSIYAAPLPILVVAAMLGIDDAEVGQFKFWSSENELVYIRDRSADEQRRLDAAYLGLNGCLARAIADRRECPRDDLISALVAVEEEGDKLTETEIINNCRLLLVAGNLTTTDLIGNAVVALLRYPLQLIRLRAEPDLWPDAVEEVLRYDPPVAHWNRQALQARQIGGCPIEAGQTITAMLLAANHDPALHADPHRLDIKRRGQKHYSFGGGAHFCPGASLGRLEARTGLTMLFSRFPKLRLALGYELRRKARPPFNGYEAIWLNVD